MGREVLKAPFPYFGGKSRVALRVWEYLGDVKNYVEPFFGSGAVLLSRPHPAKIETVNDSDGLLVNAWRGIRNDPEKTAYYADNPVAELDLTARHLALLAKKEELTARLEADPEYCDPKLAGWWIWGASSWLGSGWCTGEGPWVLEGGRVVKKKRGRGVNKQLPHLGVAGKGVNRKVVSLYDYFEALSSRLRRVRIACGDFERVLSYSVTTMHGLTGVFLDPPYEHGGDKRMYAEYGDASARAEAWAKEHADDPLLRIVLCGYGDEHDALLEYGFEKVPWKNRRGYQKVREDGTHSGHNEALWVSPHALGVKDETEGRFF